MWIIKTEEERGVGARGVKDKGKEVSTKEQGRKHMINESQCYIIILSVHHNYIKVSLVGPKVILKAGEVAMMG